jgi:hypothetical protein
MRTLSLPFSFLSVIVVVVVIEFVIDHSSLLGRNIRFSPALWASILRWGILSGGSLRSPPATIGTTLRAFIIRVFIHLWRKIEPPDLFAIVGQFAENLFLLVSVPKGRPAKAQGERSEPWVKAPSPEAF